MAPEIREPAIRIKNLGYRYRGQEKPALDGIDLEVAEGEFVVRGRSTREGKVGEFAREDGLVFQDCEAQLFSTNVVLDVAFGPEIRGMQEAGVEERVREALAALGLGLYEQGFVAADFAPDAGGAGGAVIGLSLLPFLAASFMLGGREQAEAAEEEADSPHVR